MTKKYEYLQKFVNSSKDTSLEAKNIFYPVCEEDINQTEMLLKIEFPSQLKEFYREIGYGFLIIPKNPPKDYKFYNTNRINPPSVIKDILIYGSESGLISRDVYEDLQPGDLPFFEIGDSSSFLIMKLKSDNPNAVWCRGDIKIEDSFERFIWRLYYEDPAYYGAIIEVAYK
ncbi:MAG: SMI1/KNR4 family protein [Alphaproteobacteria bacterium]|nr:SMI1/KNR4 family protein [Alphaproteobacteria bacterium]